MIEIYRTERAFFQEYLTTYSDLDEKSVIRPARLLEALQNLSMYHSDNAGYTTEYMNEHHLGWVLTFWHLKIGEWPGPRQELMLSTWVEGYRHIQANRNFAVEDRAGKEFCYGESRWVLIDTDKRRPVKLDQEWFKGYTFEDCREIPPNDFKKIERPEAEPTQTAVITVTRRDMDTNGHVNNTVYMDWVMNMVPDEIYDNRTMDEFWVTYKKECRKGSNVKISEWIDGDFITFILDDADDPSVTYGQIITKWA